MAQQLYLEGFADARCNGLYDSIDGRAAADGSDDAQHAHYVNSSSGVHLFHSTAIQEWCLKDSYEPGARSAKAIATWGSVDGRPSQPQPGLSSWQIWAGGWWDSAAVRLVAGEGAHEAWETAALESLGAGAGGTASQAADWGGLSREIVMHVLHHNDNARSRGAMACTCSMWRDATRERRRRPSTVVSGSLSSDTTRDWIARRMAAAPHSFG
jgi:hypothetical protein